MAVMRGVEADLYRQVEVEMRDDIEREVFLELPVLIFRQGAPRSVVLLAFQATIISLTRALPSHWILTNIIQDRGREIDQECHRGASV